MIENGYIHYLGLISVWRQWWRRRPACTCGRAATTAEEAGSSGVDDGGVESA
jgi:hypothetical protein